MDGGIDGVTLERVPTNGIHLEVAVAGPADGPPVFLLHGFPESWWCWRHQIPTLVEAGYRVYAPSLRGYGASDAPRGIKPYGIDDLTDDIAGLLDHYGHDKAAIVGHDWGGAITWHFGFRHSERATRLCVLNCPPAEVVREAIFRFGAQTRRSWYVLVFQLPWLPERLLRKNDYSRPWAAMAKKATDRSAFTEADRAHYVEAWSRPYALSAMVNYYRAALWVPPEPSKHLPIPNPLLLIWGTADHALGTELIAPSAERASDFRVLRLEGISHWVNVDAADAVNDALLSWLGGDEPEGAEQR